MCGIAGILTLERPITADLVAGVIRMMDAQAHRGPDDWGLLIPDEALQDPEVRALLNLHGIGHVRTYPGGIRAPAVVLGTRRLSIIDLSPHGRMPMGGTDGRTWLTYNGEIYNFQQLRDELIAQGHRFRSKTDTEVLVHGYEELGIEGLLACLRGMFAFALYDCRSHNSDRLDDLVNSRLILARDRLGKKPLYYFWDRRKFLFSSELKSIMASGIIERRLNPAAVTAYLTFGSIPAPLTMIDGVKALPPGSYLVLQEGKLELKRYWRLTFDEDPNLTRQEVIGRLREYLQESVKMRLVSDVPVGAFLSGGIDSSAIVSLMREAKGGTIRTFSITFREQEFNEGSFAKLVAERFGTEHTEYEVTAEEVLNELERIIWAMDQPTVDGVNTYFVSKVTRESGTIVALSGLGGDELFGGYSSFQLVPNLYRISSLIQAIPGGRWAAERILGWRTMDGRVKKLKALLGRDPSPEVAYLAVRGLFLDEALKDVVAPDLLEEGLCKFAPLEYLREITNGAACRVENTVSLLELRAYLHNQLLRDTDVMSMAHSLEVRTPFLDHRLVEFLAKVPARYKFTAKPKSLLLAALEGKLPREVTERPKGTFTFPFKRWLSDEWRETIEDNLQVQNSGVLNRNAIMSLWRGFLRGRIHWSRIWALVVLQLWISQYVNGPEVRS